MSSHSARWTALIGALGLLVIGAVAYFVASSATPATQDPAATASSPAPQPTGQEQPAALPEPEPEPVPEPEPAPQPPADPERYSYEKSLRWGPEMVPPPELTPDEQVLADVACNFASAQYDYDPTQVSRYEQIMQRSEPFADPALYANIVADVAEFGSIGDYELWVREGATVSVVCAAAPIGDPVPVTTRAGLDVDAWPIYTRTRVRMDLPDANPEQSYPTFVLYVAELAGVPGPRVVEVEVQGGAH